MKIHQFEFKTSSHPGMDMTRIRISFSVDSIYLRLLMSEQNIKISDVWPELAVVIREKLREEEGRD